MNELGVDLLSIVGHKLYAPKGIGALSIKTGTPIESFVHGAGHERGKRAGTENVLLAIGLEEACKLVASRMYDIKIKELRDYFWNELKSHFKERIVLNRHPEERLPNTLNVSFVGKIGQDILNNIPMLAASTGSACHSGMIHLSLVLKAMGVDEHAGKGAVRFSLGKSTTKEEIDIVLQWLKKEIIM